MNMFQIILLVFLGTLGVAVLVFGARRSIGRPIAVMMLVVLAIGMLATLDPETWRQALVTAGWRNADVVSAEVQDLVAAVEVLDDGAPLWYGLIALALLFLLIEMMLLKRKSATPNPVQQTG